MNLLFKKIVTQENLVPQRPVTKQSAVFRVASKIFTFLILFFGISHIFFGLLHSVYTWNEDISDFTSTLLFISALGYADISAAHYLFNDACFAAGDKYNII